MAQLLGKWNLFRDFQRVKFILSLTKTKKELRQAPTTNNLVLYMVWNDTSKRGGTLRGLRIIREREEYVIVGILILRKPH